MITVAFQPSVHAYTFTQTLFSTPQRFSVRWNTYDSSWYFDVADASGAPIASGMRIVLGAILNRRVTDNRMAPCLLIPIDTSGQGAEAGFDDLGTRVIVAALHYDEVGVARKFRSWQSDKRPDYATANLPVSDFSDLIQINNPGQFGGGF